MSWTRLLHVESCSLSTFPLTELPPYIAVSHTWSDALFPVGVEFPQQKGCQAVRNVIAEWHSEVEYCWIDTCCIDQNDDEDKMRQVPLMHKVFGEAECVAVVLDVELGLTQEGIYNAFNGFLGLGGAFVILQEYPWGVDEWNTDEGRAQLMEAADCLVPLTRSPWATRVWTLQEFILAKEIIWIGSDLIPIEISEHMVERLCNVCKEISLKEFFREPYSNIGRYFHGMMTMRAKNSDESQVMELLGNRHARFSVDEVFGAMAASGVTIEQRGVTTKEEAWRLWWEEAVRKGCLRWVLKPLAMGNDSSDCPTSYPQSNCMMPSFSTRHLSPGMRADQDCRKDLDVSVEDGVVELTGCLAGVCHIVYKLGRVHRDEKDCNNVSITIILFAAGKWERALRVARLFIHSRLYFNHSKLLVIAQILVDNFATTRHTVLTATEQRHAMKFRRLTHVKVWRQFIHWQSFPMGFLQEGIVFLAHLVDESHCTDIAIVTNDPTLPGRRLVAINPGVEDRQLEDLLIIAEVSDDHINRPTQVHFSSRALHKIGMSATVLRADGDNGAVCTLTDQNKRSFRIGGRDCFRCGTG